MLRHADAPSRFAAFIFQPLILMPPGWLLSAFRYFLSGCRHYAEFSGLSLQSSFLRRHYFIFFRLPPLL